MVFSVLLNEEQEKFAALIGNGNVLTGIATALNFTRMINAQTANIVPVLVTSAQEEEISKLGGIEKVIALAKAASKEEARRERIMADQFNTAVQLLEEGDYHGEEY